MTRTTTLTLGLASLLLLQVAASSADEPKSKISGAPRDLLGGYTIVSGEKYGIKEPAERIEGTTVRIADDAIVVMDKDKKEVYAQTYKVDTKSTPWKITLKSKITPKNQGAGETEAKGLIEKKGDTVRIIYALPGGEMPAEFKTKEKQIMFVLKDEKKGEKK
jgi:uncharacterized protein (TIGR03067 family)